VKPYQRVTECSPYGDPNATYAPFDHVWLLSPDGVTDTPLRTAAVVGGRRPRETPDRDIYEVWLADAVRGPGPHLTNASWLEVRR
jgi:hypothetical protein